jgi:hypothetical protein
VQEHVAKTSQAISLIAGNPLIVAADVSLSHTRHEKLSHQVVLRI